MSICEALSLANYQRAYYGLVVRAPSNSLVVVWVTSPTSGFRGGVHEIQHPFFCH